MNFVQQTWSTSMIVFALLAIGAIFYLAWRFVIRAKQGNRSVRREQASPSQRDKDTRSS